MQEMIDSLPDITDGDHYEHKGVRLFISAFGFLLASITIPLANFLFRFLTSESVQVLSTTTLLKVGWISVVSIELALLLWMHALVLWSRSATVKTSHYHMYCIMFIGVPLIIGELTWIIMQL